MNTPQSPNPYKSRFSVFKFIAILVFITFTLYNTYLLSVFSSIVSSVEKYNEGIVDEIGKSRNTLQDFSSDLNEIRQFLLLPIKKYSFNSNLETDQDQNLNSTSTIHQSLFAFLNTEKSEIQKKIYEEKINELINEFKNPNSTISNSLRLNNLFAEILENKNIKIYNSEKLALFNIEFKLEENKAIIQSIIEINTINDLNSSDLEEKILNYIAENFTQVEEKKSKLQNLKSELLEIFKKESIHEILKSKQISTNPEFFEDETSIFLSLNKNKLDYKNLIRIDKFDYSLNFVGENKKHDVKSLESELSEKLKKFEIIPEELKNAYVTQQEFEKTLKDPVFIQQLKEIGVKEIQPPKNEPNKILYNAIDENNKIKFTFIIDLSSGMLKVLKNGIETDLESFLEYGSKKKP